MNQQSNTSSVISSSRRRFLKNAVGASTVFAVPNILTRPLFGAPSANGIVNVALIGCGNIGKLEKMFVWSRGVRWDVANYHVKPYGSSKEIPVPEDLDYDAWMGPSEMVPYTADRCTNWGGYHCPETSLGFIAGCAVHELGLAQWGNKSDHTSPIRYEGTSSIPQEGIFRTLETWDVNCDYENGVNMRLMEVSKAEQVFAAMPEFGGKYNKLTFDGVIFKGTEGWITDANGFGAHDREIWRTKFKDDDEDFAPATEHVHNFIECVKSRKETMCPVEMAIRTDTICHLANAAAIVKRPLKWDPVKEEIIGDADATRMLSRPFRDKWKIW